jgi:UDP-2,4-diacetamido-2,4,6-trideoxy-beta-L-altropyranose hydrolase
MDKRTIIFRADGGPSIGMGHFIRTLALAEMLNEQFFCIFATRQPTEYQIAEIEKICQSRIDLPEDDSHFIQFLELLNGDEIVVLDNYYFTTDYQKAIKAKGCKLVCIDDLHDKHYVADIVINHAEGLNPQVYSLESYSKLLMGYPYALTRKEFRTPHETAAEKKYACMVMMGGADPFNITTQIIHTLANVEFEEPIVIVNSKEPIKSQAPEEAEKFIYLKNQTAHQIAELMRNSGFGVFPASTVALEACAVRLPFVCGYFVDNQKEIYNGIEQNSLAVCIGNLNELEEKQITEAVEIICSKSRYESIAKKQHELMDNQSDKRLLKVFNELWS